MFDQISALTSEALTKPYDLMSHKFDPKVNVRAAILMSGIYNIADHFLHEASRAVEHISPMKPAMHGNEVFL